MKYTAAKVFSVKDLADAGACGSVLNRLARRYGYTDTVIVDSWLHFNLTESDFQWGIDAGFIKLATPSRKIGQMYRNAKGDRTYVLVSPCTGYLQLVNITQDARNGGLPIKHAIPVANHRDVTEAEFTRASKGKKLTLVRDVG